MSSSRAIERARRRRQSWGTLVCAAFLLSGCSYDRSDRWLGAAEPAPLCSIGTQRCHGGLENCVAGADGPAWQVMDDCTARGLVCAPTLLACTACIPNAAHCSDQDVVRCDPLGAAEATEETCDTSAFQACRDGACVDLCALASVRRSNIGCEYWAVDLDNAKISDASNAAAQQYAVVVSNPQPDVASEVTIAQDDTEPGTPNAPTDIATATIPPFSLRVFKLGPREVDGSPDGEFNTGTHTALTRHAYRVRSTFPVVAYQFNPLENVNVFSNDASLLKPTESLSPDGDTLQNAYVVLGWPQTIASTGDPDTNFNPRSPINLRAFLTLVGTRSGTHVQVQTQAAIVGGGPVPATAPGDVLDFELGAFDVLNLETGDFNADFTGSIVSADGPVVVFSGSEASDAPFFSTLSQRRCCADHLEEQLDYVRTAGKSFVAAVSPSRSAALIQAGAAVGLVDQMEYFRVIAATASGAHITTSLSGDYAQFALPALGAWADIPSSRHFTLQSDEPVMLSSVSPSQEQANIPVRPDGTTLPGGDPSLLIIPPVEQFRSSYVFLTPDKYVFDFIRVIAPPDATVVFDGRDVTEIEGCRSDPGDGIDDPTLRPGGGPAAFVVYTCQLSFPIVDEASALANKTLPGLQNDGVHRVESNAKVGVLVDGFDSYVSYAYAAGTELEFIVPK